MAQAGSAQEQLPLQHPLFSAVTSPPCCITLGPDPSDLTLGNAFVSVPAGNSYHPEIERVSTESCTKGGPQRGEQGQEESTREGDTLRPACEHGAMRPSPRRRRRAAGPRPADGGGGTGGGRRPGAERKLGNERPQPRFPPPGLPQPPPTGYTREKPESREFLRPREAGRAGGRPEGECGKERRTIRRSFL